MHKKLNFDICTFCNHSCSFCSNGDKRTIKNVTSLKNFEKTMDNVLKYVEVSEIGLSAKGEVFLNKDLLDIVKLCKQKYKISYVYISTNGALCRENKAQKLLEAGLDSIKFSINAINQNDYKLIHKKDDFDRVIENFKALLQLKKEKFHNVKLIISSVLNKISQDELQSAFRKIFAQNFDQIDHIWYYPLGFTAITKVETTKILRKCTIAFDEIYINSDCSLGLCCKDYFDEINFGSLLENDFLKLYNSDRFNLIRSAHKSGNFDMGGGLELCKRCLSFQG
ncbi:radical SAM domain-containing protein (SPASM domain) [Campylobacter sputorum aubsp. sputorum RM3237]|uniref:radical SAM/SPASM domain-containing protein n=1 Tax=Campylobacter sputorum TaxID=206 RepID=UPI000B778CEA|nr:radical SAM/SPASM domain-containing protein [Campylobacter sputorum]ASM35757.1 radical SAM domain-containing protein (SPASM domain) [Campylobacter sputorum aubsp. sputorum RM3237]